MPAVLRGGGQGRRAGEEGRGGGQGRSAAEEGRGGGQGRRAGGEGRGGGQGRRAGEEGRGGGQGRRAEEEGRGGRGGQGRGQGRRAGRGGGQGGRAGRGGGQAGRRAPAPLWHRLGDCDATWQQQSNVHTYARFPALSCWLACTTFRVQGTPAFTARALSLSLACLLACTRTLFLSPGLWRRGISPPPRALCAPDCCGCQ